MSQTYIATFVNLLVMLLPLIGVKVGSAEMTTTVQVITAIITGVWVLVRRYQVGDITPLGHRL